MAEPARDSINDLTHVVFDVITWRSPMRKKAFRNILYPVSSVLLASGDPHTIASGAVLKSLLDIFSERMKGREKK